VIFVTVGTQMPFDRLVITMDRWAAAHRDHSVVAQIGNSGITPGNLRSRPWMSSTEFGESLHGAEVIVSHAGIGTILQARQAMVPIVVMPRRVRFGEHRDDHQIETARRLEALGVVSVAWDERELPARLEAALESTAMKTQERSSRPAMIAALRKIILDEFR